jgi:hypothetical protein
MTSSDALDLGAVRVFFGFALGVVLAVDGDPLLGHHAGAEPQPEAEEVRGDRAEVHGAMGLRAVQEDRDRRDGDVRGDERVQHDLPPCDDPTSRVRASRWPRSGRQSQEATLISILHGRTKVQPSGNRRF